MPFASYFCILCLALPHKQIATAGRMSLIDMDDMTMDTDLDSERADVTVKADASAQGFQTLSSADWDPVRRKLYYMGSLSFSAGNKIERTFTFEGPSAYFGRKMSTAAAGMSIGKFPTAVIVAGAVARGKLTFETKVSDVFSWWDTSPKDNRSAVTLRHLLTFTSGFIQQGSLLDHTHDMSKITCLNAGGRRWTIEECAKQIYEKAPHSRLPGEAFDYNSLHLQVAMAMACAASKMTPRELIKQNLLEPAQMTQTWWAGGDNPPMAFGIITSADDLDSFGRSYLNYMVLPKRIIEEMNKEYVQAHKCKVLSGSTVKWAEDQEFAMGHVSSRKFRGGPELTLNRRVQWWYGAFGAGVYIDFNAGLYITIMTDSNKIREPISVVAPLVYKAMGKKSPVQGESAEIPDTPLDIHRYPDPPEVGLSGRGTSGLSRRGSSNRSAHENGTLGNDKAHAAANYTRGRTVSHATVQ